MGFLSSLFGVGSRTPKTETVVQAQKLPEEIAPFVKEILKEAQDLYKGEIERGYDPYTGQMIAPLTEDEQQAMTGISGLVGTTKPYLEEALETYRTGAEQFTPEAAQAYMSPYQRAVTDIEKREAQKVFERDIMPQFEKKAVEAGGMSGLGTRAGIMAGQLGQAQMQQMGDIEARGLQSAFQNAQAQFAQQKARERQMAGDVGRTGTALFGAGLAEQGALQTVGQQKRELAQSALDEAYGKFLEERSFPQKTLADYSGMVYANPFSAIPSKTSTTTGMPGAPGIGQQMLGLGMTGLNIYGAGTVGGGPWSAGQYAQTMLGKKASGGRLSGLSSLPVVRRQTNGPIKPLFTLPSVKDNVVVPSGVAAKTMYPHLDPKKVEDINKTSISKLQNIFSASKGKETNLLNAYLKRKKELLGDEGYPFANIQSAISAAMDEPTIAMGIIKGVEKAGKLTKDDKKEVKLAELKMLTEEFGLEKEQLEKNEKRALNIFERNASLRKRLLSLPSELRDKVREQITFLKGNQIKDATIAELLAKAEKSLRGVSGVASGIPYEKVPGLLQSLRHPLGSPKEGQSIVPGGAKSNSAGALAATAAARKIMIDVQNSLKNTPAGKIGGTVKNAQMAALQDPANLKIISDAYHNAMKTGDSKNGSKPLTAKNDSKPPTATDIIEKSKQKLLEQRR